MRWSRTFKFKERQLAADFIKSMSLGTIFRWVSTEYTSVRITCEENDRNTWDKCAAAVGAEPTTEWEDRYI